MRKVLDKYALFIPGALLLIFCLVEWWFFISTPYSYFYSRGVHTPNVDYVATSYGDLTPEDIFITKYPRESRYITDQYGARNINMPPNVDVLILSLFILVLGSFIIISKVFLYSSVTIL